MLLRDARISELQAQLLLVGRAEGARAVERDADVAVWVDRCNALRATCERQGAELEAARRAERRAAAAAEEEERRVREELGGGGAVREKLAGAQGELRQQRARCSALEMELRQLQRRQQGQGQLAGEADEWSDEEEEWGGGVQGLETMAWGSNGSWGGGLVNYDGVRWRQQGAAAIAAAAAAAAVTGAGVGGARSSVRSKASAALRRLEVRPRLWCPCRCLLGWLYVLWGHSLSQTCRGERHRCLIIAATKAVHSCRRAQSLTSTWSAAEGASPFGRGEPPAR